MVASDVLDHYIVEKLFGWKKVPCSCSCGGREALLASEGIDKALSYFREHHIGIGTFWESWEIMEIERIYALSRELRGKKE